MDANTKVVRPELRTLLPDVECKVFVLGTEVETVMHKHSPQNLSDYRNYTITREWNTNE